ncbi:AraC family transcriptional regulator [Embleya sp. NPDC127516]|uniref:AraC family transcriptional regulator n=1 Tax=Embleya sp. NPDC127516 TaxID=3363990 RepID=UPI00382F8B82
MDFLGRITASLRTHRPRWVRIQAPDSWGRYVRPETGEAAFHVVLRGDAVLTTAGGARLTLGAGDVTLVTGAGDHLVSGGTTVGGRASWPALDFGDRPYRLLPEADPGATPTAHAVREPTSLLLSGVFRLDGKDAHAPPVELPEMIRLAAGPEQEASVRGVVELLRHEAARPGPGDGVAPDPGVDAVTGTLLDTLLLCVLRSWSREHGARTGWGPAVYDPAIGRVLCAMHRSPEQPWTVERLGALADLPRSTFARRFTESVGRPPLGHLTLVRMNAGAALLRDTDEPLSAVAQSVGYASEFAFSTAFRREFGIAPGAYRREPGIRVA